MIRVERSLVDGRGKAVRLPELHFAHSLDALHHHIEVDLALGGFVVSTNDNKIRVETSMGALTEVSVYRGPGCDLRVLRTFLHYKNDYQGRQTTRMVDGTESEMDESMLFIHPEVEALILHGTYRANVATLLACDIIHPDEIRAHHRHPPADIIGGVLLMREGTISCLSEVLATAA